MKKSSFQFIVIIVLSIFCVALVSCGKFWHGSTYKDKFLYYVYVANQTANTVSGFSVNSETRELIAIPGTNIAATSGTWNLCQDPQGRFLYVSGSGGGLYVFTINASTGSLTVVPGSPFGPCCGGIQSVAAEATGKFVFSSSSGNSIYGYSVDQASGALTLLSSFPVGNPGNAPYASTINSTGRYLYLANHVSNDVSGYSIDPSTGQLTTLAGSPYSAGSIPHSIFIDNAGKFLYVANNSAGGGVSVYTIDQTSGVLAPSGSPSAANFPNAAVVDPGSKFGFVTSGAGGNFSTYSVNSQTGALTALPYTGNGFEYLALDPWGQSVYATDFAGLVWGYSINSSTGALTSLPNSPYATQAGSLGIALVRVPNPNF